MNIILFKQNEILFDGRVFLDKRDARAVHLIKTLHKKEGSIFDAGIIEGKIGIGTITKIDDTLELCLLLEKEPLEKVPVTLGVGFVRPIQLRRILREAANFGAAVVDIFGTELGDANYRQTTLFDDGGAEQALLEGLTEARDTRFPAVNKFYSIKDWVCALDKRGKNASRLVFDNIGGSEINAPPCPPFVLAVGSERGFSKNERAFLRGAGFMRVSLGPRALRTETACIAAMAHTVL